ncbi:hypothetical protein [Streptomyces winkii]|uniref:hypothetical protein n=1 Tax=Streptomyces winkii TaxID=3051178 RepID=UPI0028D5D43C|nr:hypothetical protein [Streptomyces sp. DSM 40971]
MRSVIRPAFVGLAVVGMAFAGAASAQACDDEYSPSEHASSVNVEDSFNTIEDSFNETTFTNSFNGSIIDGGLDVN